MKKKFLLFVLSTLSVFMLASCGENNDDEKDSVLDAVKFENKKFSYDDSIHEIYVENLPSDYRVEYENNSNKEIGNHLVKAKIYKNDNLVKKMGAEVTIDTSDNEEFTNYLNQFFLDSMGHNIFSWNQLIKDKESVGYVRPENLKYEFGGYITTTLESIESTQSAIDNMLDDYNKYKNYQLSIAQRKALEKIKEQYVESNLTNKYSRYEEFYDLEYVNEFGGIVSSVISKIKDFKFYNKTDVEDILYYISTVKNGLPSFIDYMNDAIEFNLPISDTVIDKMHTYLRDILSEGEDHYLYTLLKNKVENASFLSAEEKSLYKDKFVSVLNNDFMPALNDFDTEMLKLKGNLNDTKSIYELNEIKGDSLNWYENTLKAQLGYETLDLNDYFTKLENFSFNELNQAFSAQQDLYYTGSTTAKAAYENYTTGKAKLIDKEEPEDMMAYLKDVASSMVYDLKTDPEIKFEYLDPAYARTTNVSAYYILSAFDSSVTEYVTINGETNNNPNELLITLGHEGYPGHLYAHVYAKENEDNYYTDLIISNLTFGEGWATYVENKVLEYIGQNASLGKKTYCEFERHYSNFAYCINVICDYLVNYLGKTTKELGNYFVSNGLNAEAAESIANTIKAMPLAYEPYGYGRYKFLTIHNTAKNELKNYYDEKEFNAEILKYGSVSLSTLDEMVKKYIEKVKIINGQF